MDPEGRIPLISTLETSSTDQLHHSDRINNPEWYYWEAVHYAAYHVEVPKLSAIVDKLKENELNALTVFSENALHVLLSYGRQTVSFDVQLSNGWESRICHVIAKEKPEIIECARILIDAGVNINHNNLWNETPLLIAIKYRQLEVVKLLLQNPEIDLDTCKTVKTGKSARDLLKQHEIHLDLLNQSTTLSKDPVQTLFTFLKSGNEETFLRYNNENIQQYVDKTDGGFTMLELCLIKGYLLNYQKNHSTAQHSTQQNYDLMNSPMLDFFCSQGFGRSVKHLLDNGASILKKNAILGLNVYQLSVKLGYYPFLAVLLEHRSNQITKRHLIEELKQFTVPDFEDERKFNDRQHVVHLLVSKLEVFGREESIDENKRDVLNNILELYLQHDKSSDKYKENICQLLKMGATLTLSDRLKNLSYESLKMHLDECIDGDVLFCDSFVFDNEKCYSETEALHQLCHDSKKKELLNHPALIYFIHRKWLRTNKYFYINLALYGFFLASLYCYVLSLQIHRPSAAFKGIFVVFLMVQALKEVIQLALYWKRYFFYLHNYLEIFAIACSIVNVIGQNQHTMVVAILLSSCVFLMTLGQMPTFTKYMIIFNSTKYFLEYAAFYFIQFVSFALCFFILLPPQGESEGLVDALGTISLRLFETLIYFIGQYDGDVNSVPEFPVFGRFIVAVFIFCMTIILNNLLVGLIVTDMEVIQKNGKLQRQVEMIRFISRIETFLNSMEGNSKGGKILSFRLKKFYSTLIFTAGERKTIKGIMHAACFDDDDIAWLKRISENKSQNKNVLYTLYDYITSEINSDHKSLKENRDILFKLSRLEKQIRGGRPR